MVLNLHGEVPSDASTNTCVLNAEPTFLPHLRKLHARFPRLRIVLEHATTRAAVECVKTLGDTVACTITAHHLALTVDDWAGQSWNFCKPVAKYPDDRQALRDVIKEGAYPSVCLPRGYRSPDSRSSSLLPGLRLGAPSSRYQVHSLSVARMCGRRVYVCHPPTPCGPPARVVWRVGPSRRVREYERARILPRSRDVRRGQRHDQAYLR